MTERSAASLPRSLFHPSRAWLLCCLLAGWLIASTGCAILPHRSRPQSPIILMGPELVIDSLATAPMGPPDSLSRVVVEPSPARIRPPRPSTPPPEPEDSHLTPPSNQPETEPERSISVEMSDSDRERLASSYKIDRDSADKTIRRLSEKGLPQEDMDKLQTAKGLVDQATVAFEQQDLQAAANLAHKARVLAEEIASP